MVATRSHGGRNRKLRAHVFNHRRRESESEVGQSYGCAQPSPSATLPPARIRVLKSPWHPKQHHQRGQSVQILESMETFFIQTTTNSKPHPNKLCFSISQSIWENKKLKEALNAEVWKDETLAFQTAGILQSNYEELAVPDN